MPINTLPMLEIEDELEGAGITPLERAMLGSILGGFIDKAGIDLTERTVRAMFKTFRSITPQMTSDLHESVDAVLMGPKS